MTPERYAEIQETFLKLRELGLHIQTQKLTALRKSDSSLADEVESMLAADKNAGSFIDTPLVHRDHRIDIETQDIRQSDPDVDGDSSAETPTHIGPYRVLQKIGEGGHGVVFMAEQFQPIRRKVAIKWIKRGMDSDMILARFEAEWQALAMMKHPSIANVIEAKSTDSGQPYFVMELVHGIPIDEFCDQNKLNLSERLTLFQQVCGAVHHAHQKGIIHRDIKPANVLITTDSGKPLAKVIDFGIAKALHMPLTEKTMFTEYGQIVGTLEYMSPEQALMSQTGIDVRSDVYSLGVLLYLLLTGETPVSRRELLRDGIWELKNILQSTQPQTPSTRITSRTDPARWRDHAAGDASWARNVSGDLDWITMKAIAREPEQRYDSAADFAGDIDRFLDGDAIEARPPSRWYQFSKFIGRNRIAAAASIAVGISLLGALIAFSLLYFQSVQHVTFVEEKSSQLEEALDLTEQYAGRLAKSLSRQTIETAWRSATSGDYEEAIEQLEKVPEDGRDQAWKLAVTMAKQYQLPVFRSGFEANIRSLTVDESGNRIAVINSASEAEIWDATSLELLHKLQLPTAIYTAASFSNCDTLLVGGPGNALVKVDLQLLSCHQQDGFSFGAVRAIDYDKANQSWWLTTGGNAVLQLREADLRLLQPQIDLDQRIRAITISEDGASVAVGSLKGDLYVIDSDDTKSVRKFRLSDVEVCQLGFKDDTIIVGDLQGKLYSIPLAMEASDSTNISPLATMAETPIAGTIGSGSSMFSAHRDGSVWLFEDSKRIPLRAFEGAVRRLAWLDSVERLFAVHADGRISVFDQREISRWKKLSALPVGVVDGDLNPRIDIGATSHLNGEIKTWNRSTGSMMKRARLHSTEPLEMEISRSGTMLASVALDKTMVLCSLPNLDVLHKLKIGWGVRGPAFSPDGKLVAGPAAANNPNNGREGTIDIWDVELGQSIKRLAGHGNWVLKTQFISDIELVSLSVDGTLKFWSVTSAECLQTINFSALGNATCFAWHGDRDEISLGHSDGLVSTWNRQTGKLVRSTVAASSSIAGLAFVDGDQPVLMVAIEGDDKFLLLDTKLQPSARLTSGVGTLKAFRPRHNSALLIGESGLVKMLRLTGSSLQD